MTTTTNNPDARDTSGGGENFTTSEGRRRPAEPAPQDGPGRRGCTMATVRDLMEYAAEKYTPLARKHGLDPWEAVTAAFEAMQYRSTREADDPWRS